MKLSLAHQRVFEVMPSMDDCVALERVGMMEFDGKRFGWRVDRVMALEEHEAKRLFSEIVDG